MGGKGQKRREKNYLAAHGGDSRLPPPPKAEQIDALPSKLRKIIELKNPNPGHSRAPGGAIKEKKNKNKTADADRRKGTTKVSNPSSIGDTTVSGVDTKTRGRAANRDPIVKSSSNDVSKGKRKRKTVNDLIFQNLDENSTQTRKKRKKEFLKARKENRKKAKTDDVLDFPRHEKIQFGDIAEAPPKLSFPKMASKATMTVSQERKRLLAMEAYRKKRGWDSRPGIQLPSLSEAPSS